MIRPNPRADARTLLGVLAYFGIVTSVIDPEVRVLSRFVRPGSVTLDIGAGVGLYAFPLARLVGPLGRVLAFEPFPPSARRLTAASRFLRLDNLEVIRAVLSDGLGDAALATPVSVGGRVNDQWAHVATPADGTSQRIPATTIDHETESRRLERVDFIKCDVEGYESAVFRGGERTVRSFRPVILCEIEQRWTGRYGRNADRVMEEIRALGDYRVAVYEPTGLRPVDRVDRSHNDYFFLRRESAEEAGLPRETHGPEGGPDRR
jgi:FkbM family methyltransferase